MPRSTDSNEALKRLGGGRWQTRDERFTIEPQSGTWVVVDADQTDDLGLPLVRGPFGSLRDAKEAIELTRGSDPTRSPLTARVEEFRSRPKDAATPAETRSAVPTEPDEPRWLTDLDPDERRRARQLIARLADVGAPDPDGMARRDVVGNVATTAAYAVARAIVALSGDASPATIARLLESGHAEDLGVRWRLVDGDGRPISLDLDLLD